MNGSKKLSKHNNLTGGFTRTKENFICKHCGFKVKGNGYTNHCPKCLWSKHVDVNPGDRANVCGGMMEPVAVEIKKGHYTLVHQCEKCGLEKRNKTSSKDNINGIIQLVNSRKF